MDHLDELKAETDRIKSEVNLIDFVSYYDKFKLDIKKNSHNQIENMNCIFMRNDVDDKLIISRNTNGHYIYFNPENDRDKGTIFDFIENRRAGENYSMAYAKKIINDFSGNIHKNYIKPTGLKLEAKTNESALIKVQTHFKKLPELTDSSFLESRGLSKELLESPVCKKRIYSEMYTDKNTGAAYTNTVFPLFGFDENNKSVVLGFERRNDQFKGAFEGSLKSASIWVSSFNKSEPVNNFVVSESAIDSLSYAQIKNDWRSANNVYAATSGSAWDGHIDLYQKTINNFKPNAVVLANDNDCAGERFNCKILGKLDLSKFVDQEYIDKNKMLVHANIDVSLADKYTGQIEWKLSHDKVPEFKDDKFKMLEQHIPCFKSIQEFYEGKNNELLEINRDKKIFNLESNFNDNFSSVKVKFPNNHENWKVISESIVQLKLDFAENIKIDRPVSKDWNQDLKDSLKIDNNKDLSKDTHFNLKL